MLLLLAFLFAPILSASAQNDITALQKADKAHMKEFNSLLVQDHQGRVKPMNTLASEVIRKVSRKNSIEGLSPDQVMLGMMTDPATWQYVKMIKVGDQDLKDLLGVGGKYACFNDVIDRQGQYKLARYIDMAYNKKPAERTAFDKDVIKVDERVNICYMVYSYAFFKIFPKPGDPNNTWYSPANMRGNFDTTESVFVENILPIYLQSVNEALLTGNWTTANENLGYIKTFQQKYGSAIFPPPSKTKLEILYNNSNIFKRMFPLYALVGLILLILLFVKLLQERYSFRWPIRIFTWLIFLMFILHTAGLASRWYISGHAPWSNGYETMLYISWGIVLSGLLFGIRSRITLATSAILASLTLMVANLSWMDPEITPLVPVLKSYWLVIHVAVITASYSFLGIGALLGFLNLMLIIFLRKKNFTRLNATLTELTNINEMNLIIGVFLITIGTFLGAVWANESWGRYWGWDPKETWALVTVLVYSFIIHMRLIPGMKGNYAFNFAALIGFSSVLMTYFGVNYYLSGLHSYAKGDPVPVPVFVYYSVAVVAIVSVLAYISFRKHYPDRSEPEI
jgi:cytochrome c-type biogenesis protein CcsB